MSAEALPSFADDGTQFIGPFEGHQVVLYGRRVPHLVATPMNGGQIHLQVDERYGLDLSIEEAERVVPFIADCMAIAAGWTCHPRPGEEPCRAVPFPQVFGIVTSD